MKFNINHKVKDFKNVDSFLRTIYKENPLIAETGYNEEIFINQVKAIREVEGGTIKSAINKVANTAAFTPYAERAANNIIEATKKFKKFKELSILNRDEQGHFKGFDKTQLRWDTTRGGYVYMEKYLIDVSNSPENISIVEL